MSRRWQSAVDGDRRGVSETLGYVLVFSIVVMTISTVSVVGFNGLEDRQAAEEVTNVERAFDVLRDNFKDLQRNEEPSRGTELRLASGTIGVGDPVTITVGQWNGSGFSPDNETSVTFRPLVYRSDGGDVVYEGGVVFRSDDATNGDTRSIARSSTLFIVSDQRAVLPVVATDAGGETTAVGGERSILVVGERNPRGIKKPVFNSTVSGDDLRVRIESPRADGWARQLQAEGFTLIDEADSEVTVELPVDQATMPESHVDLWFQ